MKKLFVAIRHGNLEEVKRIIEKKTTLVNDIATAPPKKDNGQSALQVALKSDNLDIAEYLLEKGANVSFCDEQVAPNWGGPVICDALFQAYGSLTPFYKEARYERYFGIIKKMIRLGANLRANDSWGRSIWYIVVFRGENILRSLHMIKTEKEREKVEKNIKDIIELFVENGVDIYSVTEEANAYFEYCYLDRYPTMKSLIEKYYDKDKVEMPSLKLEASIEEQISHYFKYKDYDKIEELIEGNEVDWTKMSAYLYGCIDAGNFDLVKLFLDKGANIEVEIGIEQTPLMIALHRFNNGSTDDPSIIRLLLKYGADRKAKSKHITAYYYFREIKKKYGITF